MSGIVHLAPVAFASQSDIVDALERLVEDAKAGRVRSFVCIIREVGTGWREVGSGCDDLIEQLGMTQLAVASVTERLLSR